MSYKQEFPNYDGKFYIPKGFEDASWHNDTCPRAQKTVILPSLGSIPEAEVSFILWQDFANPDLREYEFGKRYVFAIEVNGDVVFEYCSDDIDIVLKLIDDCVKL